MVSAGVLCLVLGALSCNPKSKAPPSSVAKGAGDSCDRRGETYCAAGGERVECGEDGLVVSSTPLSPACATAAEELEACDRPGEVVCLSRTDSGRCSDRNTIEPGISCELRDELCGWNAEASSFGCVPSPRDCGTEGAPCCNADDPTDPANHNRGCWRGLSCVPRSCKPAETCDASREYCCSSGAAEDIDGDWEERICQATSPGCGGVTEPCCDGAYCRTGGRCVAGVCERAIGGGWDCGREGEICCVRRLCFAGLVCDVIFDPNVEGHCIREPGGQP